MKSKFGCGLDVCITPVALATSRRVSIGYVVALDYTNPYLSPFQEFQNYKRHPLVHEHIKGGTCLQYGARTLNEGERVQLGPVADCSHNA